MSSPGVYGWLTEECCDVELGGDGVVFDINEVARTLWNGEPEDCCNGTRHDSNTEDPAPRVVHTPREVVTAAVAGDRDDSGGSSTFRLPLIIPLSTVKPSDSHINVAIHSR